MTVFHAARPGPGTRSQIGGRPRRFWSDVRFFIGIALILASMGSVWFVITAARQTEPVLAAVGTIVVGQTIAADDLRVVDVALGPAGDGYLRADAFDRGEWAEGVVATRTIAEGELVPASAIGRASASRTTTVVIRSAAQVPSGIGPGSVVEVWAAPQRERGIYDTPSILIADATVAQVASGESMLGARAVTLELVIERADVAKTLEAVAADAALSVVPVTGAR